MSEFRGRQAAPYAEGPLGADELRRLNAYWRAANYLSVGQIYLLDNPLLRQPLRLEHVKPRLLGHWGTTPGLNLVYAHLNRVIHLPPTAGASREIRRRSYGGGARRWLGILGPTQRACSRRSRSCATLWRLKRMLYSRAGGRTCGVPVLRRVLPTSQPISPFATATYARFRSRLCRWDSPRLEGSRGAY